MAQGVPHYSFNKVPDLFSLPDSLRNTFCHSSAFRSLFQNFFEDLENARHVFKNIPEIPWPPGGIDSREMWSYFPPILDSPRNENHQEIAHRGHNISPLVVIVLTDVSKTGGQLPLCPFSGVYGSDFLINCGVDKSGNALTLRFNEKIATTAISATT